MDLERGPSSPAIQPGLVARYGLERARLMQSVEMQGGRNKVQKRNATPRPFADILLAMAGTART
jgi:hypothetical protein